MIRRRNVGLTFGLALLLGCAGSGDTKAQEKPPGPDAPKADDKPGDGKAAGGSDARPADLKLPGKTDKPAEDNNSYKATVTDRSADVGNYTILDAVIWVPEVSILGGEGHTTEKRLTMKRGAADIFVPFVDIAWIEITALKEDRLEVVVKRRSDLEREQKNPGTKARELKGTIKSNLQLAGTYEDTQLATRLKLREVSKIVLDVDNSRQDALKPDASKNTPPK